MSHKIPIPSFAATIPADEEMDTTSSPDAPVVAIQKLHESWLVQLETALQLFFVQSKRTRISYAEICHLVPKLNLSSSHNSLAVTGGDVKHISDVILHAKHDKLWYDFYCVAVPKLYQVQQTATTVTWEPTKVQGNRLVELKKLVREVQRKGGVVSSHANKGKELLQWLHDTAAHSQQESTAPSKRSSAASQLLTPLTLDSGPSTAASTTTLEDRVRARAQQRSKLLQQVEDAQKDPMEERLAVADILYSQARHQRRREQHPKAGRRGMSTIIQPKNQTASTITTATDPSCSKSTLLMGDLWPLFQANSYSRPALFQIFKQMQDTVPEWMGWKQNQTSNSTNREVMVENTIPLSKQARIWIVADGSIDYKTVRSKLGGRRSERKRGAGGDGALSPKPVPSNSSQELGQHQRESTPVPPPGGRLNGVARPVTVSGGKRGRSNRSEHLADQDLVAKKILKVD